MSFLEKWAVGVCTALTIAACLAALALWSDVARLKQYHASEWPLERQLLMVEIAQLEAEVNVQHRRIQDLERQLRESR